jgi:hypothetical protein
MFYTDTKGEGEIPAYTTYAAVLRVSCAAPKEVFSLPEGNFPPYWNFFTAAVFPFPRPDFSD